MPQNVTDKKLYQISATNSYKQALVLNQQICAGIAYNPFFKFYETTMEYPVMDGQTGGTIQINAIDWLHRVKTGTIRTSYDILAEKAFEVSQHYMMLARELLMEQIRLEEFEGRPPSRLTCLFLSETVEEARSWLPLLGGIGTVCELMCTGMIHRVDSRLLVKVSEPLSLTKDRANAYWRGDKSSDPRLETLFVGNATVVATGL
jgi:hypothetical protein